MGEWQVVVLGEIIETNSDSFSNKDNWEYVNYLDTGNITQNRIDTIQKIDLSIEKLPSRAKRKVMQGDVLFSNVRPIQQHYGYLNSVYKNMLVSTGFTTIRAKANAFSKYIYYFLTQRDVIERLQAIAEQTVSTYPAIRPSDIEALELMLPPLPEQKAIAETLSCLDDKIELNNKINANLEQTAQAIFKSWFVDFEPFQDGEFVESELGRIPKGWRVGTLGDVANITMGQSPSGSSYNENGDGTVFYQGRAEFGWRFPTRRLFTTEPKRMATKGDVLMSVRAPVGDLNVADENCCIGRGLAAIQGKFSYSSFALYTMFNLKSRLDMFNGEGTVFGSINKDSLHNISIIVPNNEVLKRFEEAVKPLDEMIENNHKENCDLQNIRDSLLPKLMSGEIDLSEVTA